MKNQEISASVQPLLIGPIKKSLMEDYLKVQFLKGQYFLYTVASVCFLWGND